MSEPITLSAKEKRAIAALERLAKTWPDTLWLFSANGALCVMRAGPEGEHVMLSNYGVDPEYEVALISGISNSGGDW
jgi:hypothetical protein